MTIYTNTNGQCPHCKCTFDARKAALAFPGNITGKRLSLAFALCPKCFNLFEQGNKTNQASIIKKSFDNALNNKNYDWTVTSSLSLDAHLGDFFNAWWLGIDLPKIVFHAIDDGLVDEIIIPQPFFHY